MTQKVEVKITSERIEDMVTVDEFIALQEGSIKAAKSVVGKFIMGEDGQYLPDEEGASIAGKMTVRQLKDVLSQFQTGVTDLVPNSNSAASG